MDTQQNTPASILPKLLLGCVLMVGLLTGVLAASVLGVIVGQNLLIGSPPTAINADFTGDVSADGEFHRLTGEGAEVFQQFIAERSSASINPLRILAYNFDYHVMGTYSYPLHINVSPANGYRPNYDLSQSGSGFVWREDGAAFAQIRSAQFSIEELLAALEPYTQAAE